MCAVPCPAQLPERFHWCGAAYTVGLPVPLAAQHAAQEESGIGGGTSSSRSQGGDLALSLHAAAVAGPSPGC